MIAEQSNPFILTFFNIFSLLRFCARLSKTSYKWATCAFLPDPFFTVYMYWKQPNLDISNSLFNKLYKFWCRKPKKSNIFPVSLKCVYCLTTDDNLCFLHTEREAHLFVRFVYNVLEGAVYCSQKILPGDLVGIIHPSQLTGPFMSLTSVFLKLQGHCNIKKLFIFFSDPYEVIRKNIEWTSRVIFFRDVYVIRSSQSSAAARQELNPYKRLKAVNA